MSFFEPYTYNKLLSVNKLNMSTQLVTSLSSPEFSTKLNRVEFTSSDDYVDITITADTIPVLSERYTPDANGNIVLHDLGTLLAPFLISQLVSDVELIYTSEGTELTEPLTVIYTSAMVEEDTDDFVASHFLTHLTEKVTAVGRKEVLYFFVDASVTPSCTAYYSDGSTITQAYPTTYSDLDTIAMLEVSPSNFVVSGKTLIAYTITAGQRSMSYTVRPFIETAPSLLFRNSFGCEETIYCAGTETLEPKYNYTAASIEGYFRNVGIEEVKTFTALTGVLTIAMSNWADDLFRSPAVQLFTVDSHGAIVRGRQVTITEAKSVRSNESGFLPNFEFSYRYSQNNHNIFDKTVAGRIFDDTFDYSFE